MNVDVAGRPDRIVHAICVPCRSTPSAEPREDLERPVDRRHEGALKGNGDVAVASTGDLPQDADRSPRNIDLPANARRQRQAAKGLLDAECWRVETIAQQVANRCA